MHTMMISLWVVGALLAGVHMLGLLASQGLSRGGFRLCTYNMTALGQCAVFYGASWARSRSAVSHFAAEFDCYDCSGLLLCLKCRHCAAVDTEQPTSCSCHLGAGLQ